VLKVSIPPKDTIGLGDFIMPFVSGDENRIEIEIIKGQTNGQLKGN
jgi:hypothetical protein